MMKRKWGKSDKLISRRIMIVLLSMVLVVALSIGGAMGAFATDGETQQTQSVASEEQSEPAVSEVPSQPQQESESEAQSDSSAPPQSEETSASSQEDSSGESGAVSQSEESTNSGSGEDDSNSQPAESSTNSESDTSEDASAVSSADSSDSDTSGDVSDISSSLSGSDSTSKELSLLEALGGARLLASGSVDLSAYVEVTDFKLIKADDTEASETNGIAYVSEEFALEVSAKFTEFPTGVTLEDGATFTIDILQGLKVAVMPSAPAPLVADINGVEIEIGTWVLATGKKIVVTFNEEAEKIGDVTSVLSEMKFITGKTFKSDENVTKVVTVSVGECDKEILFIGVNTSKLQGNRDIIKGVSTLSNNTVQWRIDAGWKMLYDLGESGGTATVPLANYLTWDTFTGGEIIRLSISARVCVPMDDGTTTLTDSYAYTHTITSYFTDKTSGASSYASAVDFGASLGTYEYGIYTEANGTQTLYINYGTIGQDGPTYDELARQLGYSGVGEQAKAVSPLVTETGAAILDTVLGESNIIGGKVVNYRTYVTVEYPTVVAGSVTMDNTMYALYDRSDGSGTGGTPESSSASATMQSNSAGVSAAPQTVVLVKSTASGFALQGASFVLEQKSGSSWVPYAAGGTQTTGANGQLTFTGLGPGTYRLVETAAPAGYDITSPVFTGGSGTNNNEFTVTSTESSGHVIRCTNVRTRHTITYKPGLQGDFADDKHENVAYGSTTPDYAGAKTSNGNPLGKAGYVFKEWSPAKEPSVSGDKVYTAIWQLDPYVKYKVEHYLQQEGSADYAASPQDTDNKTGTFGAAPVFAAKTYTGYAYQSAKTTYASTGNSASTTALTIAADGSLVVRLYYAKQYTITYEPGTQGNFAQNKHENLLYNANTPAFSGAKTSGGAPLGKAGYVFDKWLPTVASKVTANASYVAQWLPDPSIAYKVEHYLQTANSADYEASPRDTENKTGTFGTAPVFAAKTYTGYAYQSAKTTYASTGNSASTTALTIAADGSLVVRLYYAKQYTITYEPGTQGNFAQNKHENLLYNANTPAFSGAKTSGGAPLGKAGYVFEKWLPSVASKVTAKAVHRDIQPGCAGRFCAGEAREPALQRRDACVWRSKSERWQAAGQGGVYI